jgi:hypothetical protein
MNGPLDGVTGALEDEAGLLGISLAKWAYRDEAADRAAARRAASTAMGAIDAMLARLHAARAQLVTETRQDDDAAMARAGALLTKLETAP